MQRSRSASRVSEEDSLLKSPSSSSLISSNFRPTLDTDDHLPTYDPLSHVAQRERSRLRSAQNAVHVIPLLLLLCAIILWFFSASGHNKLNPLCLFFQYSNFFWSLIYVENSAVTWNRVLQISVLLDTFNFSVNR